MRQMHTREAVSVLIVAWSFVLVPFMGAPPAQGADPPVAIHDVQGAGHISPKNGQIVTLLPAVVTALRTNGTTRGFYLQDPNPDADPATSEGIFVFTGSSSNPATLVAVGDLVQVSGRVSEYRAATVGLTVTELTSPAVVARISSGNSLPAPVVLGTGGQIPPSSVIENDATGNVETTGVFDPANDGIDFYESLEGMLVQVNDAVAVGPRADFTTNRELPVVGDNGANAGVLSNRGGIVVQATDFNPERIILNDWISGGPLLPAANVGDKFPGTIVGVMDYSFNNFKLQVISMPALVSSGLARETAPAAGPNQVTIATFNAENLAPGDPPSKSSNMADLIVNNLRSPDIVSVEELQDNTGATDDGVVDASTTWNILITAIQTAGGPVYQYRQIDPVNDQDGGMPGGNIRVGFLFRTDRGLSFIDRPGAGSLTPNAVVGSGAGTHLQYSPGRIDPTNAAFGGTRKPLVGEFMFNGYRLFVIANHWISKAGDDPLFGVHQPPTLSSEIQRNQQATVVHDFVSDILTADPGANVFVVGDLNDFQFSSALATLRGNPALLSDLIDTLPLAERYTYIFEGNSEVLDHILISDAPMAHPFVYDVVHINSEFVVQASDHDPQILLITYALTNGEPCANDVQCGSGFCVDGVCCDSDCGGGVSGDCQACSVAAGGTVDGTCSVHAPPCVPTVLAGAIGGSTTVRGLADPNQGPTCIQVRDCDGDRVCASSDDITIGSGGTNARGEFTIRVLPALTCGEMLYVVDTCQQTRGPATIVSCVAAPLLAPRMHLLLVATLALLGLVGLHRRRASASGAEPSVRPPTARRWTGFEGVGPS